MTTPHVGIVMGSTSDMNVMKEAGAVLDRFGIPHEFVIASAHRAPDLTVDYAKAAAGRGIRVLIAGAGYAAHLGGVLAANTILPVIGVPIDASPLHGLDSLLAISQMPAGVPVATVTIGSAGATNAGHLAAEILALSDPKLAEQLRAFRKTMADDIQQQNQTQQPRT